MFRSFIFTSLCLSAGVAVGATWTVYHKDHVPVKNGVAVAGAGVMTPVQQLTNAVAQAISKDTITIMPGTYDLGGEGIEAANPRDTSGAAYLFLDDKTLHFVGENATHWSQKTAAEETVIKGGPAGRVVYGYKGSGRASSFRNITFEGGTAGAKNGGAIYFSGTEFIVPYQNGCASNCVFRANSATHGGATHHVNVYDSLFEGNTSVGNGGAAYGMSANGNGKVTNDFIRCVFKNNTSNSQTSGGGALYLQIAGVVRDCVFSNNVASAVRGGAIYSAANGPSSVIQGCVFLDNHADGVSSTGEGGAIFAINMDGVILDCAFSNNTAFANGGAVCYASVVSNCTFAGNRVTSVMSPRGGGAIYVNRSSGIEIVDCVFTNNMAAVLGGAIRSSQQIDRLAGCTFVDNRANGSDGGALYTAGACPWIESCSFIGNQAVSNGGALRLGNEIGTMTNCTFVANASGGDGASFYSDKGYRLVTDCTFKDNEARGQYAGVYASSMTWAGSVENCVFDNNTNKFANVGSQIHYATNVVGCTFRGYGDMFARNYDRCTFERCRFDYDNYSGGMIVFSTATGAGGLRNCLFQTNNVHIYIKNETGSEVEIANCTFVGNEVSRAMNLGNKDMADGFLFYSFRGGTDPVNAGNNLPSRNAIVNCVFMDNTRNNQRNDVNFYVTDNKVATPAVNVFSNCVYETASFVYNPAIQGNLIQRRMKFTAGEASYGDVPYYTPCRGSAAFDRGLTLPWMAEAVDLAGNPRLNGTVDMGCYECWMPNTGTMFLIR